MELDQQVEAFRAKGLNIVALSYDSPAVLKNFHDRKKLRFPLLSDPQSKIIRDFGILNESAGKDTPFFGIPHPGTFVLDPSGKVISKYFEDNYTERETASAILVKQFGLSALGLPHTTVETPHLILTSAASAKIVRGGQKIMLMLDIELKKKMHVYAPGAQGYKTVDWRVNAGSLARVEAIRFPPSRTLYLKPIREKAPIYEGKIRLSREITLAAQKELKAAASATGEFTLEGELLYQACDDKVCYVPQTIPLKWVLSFEGHDAERAPKELRKF